ncbi:low temperature requirement protein A [Streptomyces sp. JJ36]|nr:low temperature requirement protein A [Streptomyces sp. JJ36]
MRERDPAAPHRPATPLELFFDLCFVVAVAQVSTELHHAFAEGHFAEGTGHYLLVFFAIWWAWMGFTWFASAYDTDDVPYRVATFVQITGLLVFAAGVPRAFTELDFRVTGTGYAIMRLGLVSQWLRAAHAHPERRRTSLRYAVALVAVQTGWLLFVFQARPTGGLLAVFVLLGLADLATPVWAERAGGTAWHPRHITERYGLFTIIVLGESVLAATVAVEGAVREGLTTDLLTVIAGGLLTVFALWWVYFAKPYAGYLVSNRVAFVWGYGHLLLFASVAAVGAGLAVATAHATHHADIGATQAAATVTVPVAVFLLVTWFLLVRPRHGGVAYGALLPVTAGLVLLATPGPRPVLVCGLLLAALVAVGVAAAHCAPGAEPDGPPEGEQGPGTGQSSESSA